MMEQVGSRNHQAEPGCLHPDTELAMGSWTAGTLGKPQDTRNKANTHCLGSLVPCNMNSWFYHHQPIALEVKGARKHNGGELLQSSSYDSLKHPEITSSALCRTEPAQWFPKIIYNNGNSRVCRARASGQPPNWKGCWGWSSVCNSNLRWSETRLIVYVIVVSAPLQYFPFSSPSRHMVRLSFFIALE